MEYLISFTLWLVLPDADASFLTRDQEKVIVISALASVIVILVGYLKSLISKVFEVARESHDAYVRNTGVVEKNTSALNSLQQYMKDTLPDRIAEKIKTATKD